MIRVINDTLGRALHAMLYDRLLQFCNQYTPELPGEPIVQAWLDRLYRGDLSLHVIVRLDDPITKITAHMLIDVQDIYGQRVILCHQVQSANNSIVELSEGMEYLDKLMSATQATSIIAYMSKGAKALEKKYGFTISRSVLVKYAYSGVDNTEEC